MKILDQSLIRQTRIQFPPFLLKQMPIIGCCPFDPLSVFLVIIGRFWKPALFVLGLQLLGQRFIFRLQSV
jgi:hypothetical protein